MAVFHVFKDGTKTTDIKGHVIKRSDLPMLYQIVNKIERRDNFEKKKTS